MTTVKTSCVMVAVVVEAIENMKLVRNPELVTGVPEACPVKANARVAEPGTMSLLLTGHKILPLNLSAVKVGNG